MAQTSVNALYSNQFDLLIKPMCMDFRLSMNCPHDIPVSTHFQETVLSLKIFNKDHTGVHHKCQMDRRHCILPQPTDYELRANTSYIIQLTFLLCLRCCFPCFVFCPRAISTF